MKDGPFSKVSEGALTQAIVSNIGEQNTTEESFLKKHNYSIHYL